jgi:hypothetical protein
MRFLEQRAFGGGGTEITNDREARWAALKAEIANR